MGIVFTNSDCKQLTTGAAKIVWFIIIPVMVVSSFFNHTALVIWASILAILAVVGTVWENRNINKRV